MRFWDSSALVPLVLEEERSPACRQLARADRDLCVWVLARVEIVSAVRRREGRGDLDRAGVREALRRVEALASRWTEVEAVGLVRERAERLLGAHALAAAAALQLAAALVAAGERPRRRAFVTADERLAVAAAAEGFEAVAPGG